MTTLSFIKSLQTELSKNECNALLEIIERIPATNTLYDTRNYIDMIEKKYDVNVAAIKSKLQNRVTDDKLEHNRVGKDLDLL
tara:strand:- start:282 stop:527 length:246 start_codon:yes stop_codon:yes gene_type:complete